MVAPYSANLPTFTQAYKIRKNMDCDDNPERVAREERMRLVLAYLVETESALPPAAIFRNLKLRGATFERRSVTNFLGELHERGLVQKVDTDALESGTVVAVDRSKPGYWMATEDGRELVGDG